MSKKIAALFGVVAFAVLVVGVAGYGSRKATAAEGEVNAAPLDSSADTAVVENGFSVEVLIGGASTTEYAARGRRYVEALENAEYELRIHNPTGSGSVKLIFSGLERTLLHGPGNRVRQGCVIGLDDRVRGVG